VVGVLDHVVALRRGFGKVSRILMSAINSGQRSEYRDRYATGQVFNGKSFSGLCLLSLLTSPFPYTAARE